MYCVIQKIKKKKPNQSGAAKKLIGTISTYGADTVYGYTFSAERFDRPVLDAYKISIHQSYRDNGKVKKKQWVICTMSYYDIIDYSLFECGDIRIDSLAPEIGISQEELYQIIYKKLDPIEEKIMKEFQETEEYKTKQKHEEIIRVYQEKKATFEKEYGIWGEGAYDKCFDVFGNLKNPSKFKVLEQLKSNSESNYSNFDFSSYLNLKVSNYTEEEKVMLKKIYKVASKKFHPDVYNDDGRMMKMILKLKDDWGI